MKYTTSIKLSLKYHILALLPLLVGLAIAAAGIWIGVIDPVIIALNGLDPQSLLSGEFWQNADINPLLGSSSALIGYLVHKVGRTALLMRIHGTAIESNTETMIEDAHTNQPSHRAVASAPLNPDPDKVTNDGSTGAADGDANSGHADDSDATEEDEQENLEPSDMIDSIKEDLDMDEDGETTGDDAETQ